MFSKSRRIIFSALSALFVFSLSVKATTGPHVQAVMQGGPAALSTITVTALTWPSDNYVQKSGVMFNVKDYGAKGDGVTDDTIAIYSAELAACNAITSANTILFPAGTFIVTSPISIPVPTCQLRFLGSGRFASTIQANHNGEAIVSLLGHNNCGIENLHLTSGGTFPTKTGILLGRLNSTTGGFHRISNVVIEASVTIAGLYMIASEENSFEDMNIRCYTGKYGIYTSSFDVFGVDSNIFPLTNTVNHFKRITVWMDQSANTTTFPLGLDYGGNTRYFQFDNMYLIPSGTYYIDIRANVGSYNVDTVFINLGGEPASGTVNLGGINFRSDNSTEKTLGGLKFLGNGFDQISAGRPAINVDSNSGITLSNFLYEDYRTNPASSAGDQNYWGLVNSKVSSASGNINTSSITLNNTIIADLRNFFVRYNGVNPDSTTVYANQINQFYYAGMSNQSTVVNMQDKRLTVIDSSGSASVPLRKATDPRDILPSNIIFTNRNSGSQANFQLPKAHQGEMYTIVKVTNQTVRIDHAAGDMFFATSGTSTDYIKDSTSEVYALCTVFAIEDSKWIIFYTQGTWSFTNTP